MMQLLLRALLVLLLATLAHSTRKGQPPSVKLVRQNKAKHKMVTLALNSLVQPYISSKSASTLANMSLTPWTYNESYVESRLPLRIFHAQCLTFGCLGLQGGEEDTALVAAPIRYQVLVLHRVKKQRKNKKGGRKPKAKYEFHLRTEVITVGCTCVRPSVVVHKADLSSSSVSAAYLKN